MENRWVKESYNKEVNEKITRILKIELEITDAVRNGLQASTSDEYREVRKECEQLRKEIGIR